MIDETESRGIIEPELEEGEQLLWLGAPSPKRMLIPSIFIFGFGVVWTSSIGAIIAVAHSLEGPMQALGPGRFLGDLCFVPFVLIGFVMLFSPILLYRKARRTAYGITPNRVLVVVNGRSRKVRTYGPGEIGDIERTERPDGSGDLTFARRSYRDSDGDQRSQAIEFVGIPEVRSVERLLRDLFMSKPDPT